MNYRVLATDLIGWTKDWFSKNGATCNAIIGVSGGVKSTIAVGLMALALGPSRVFGIIMRDDKDQDLDKPAIDVCKYFGVKYYQVPVYPSINALKNVMNLECKIKMTEKTVMNLPARIRMSTLYAMSQSLNGRVVNTSCLSDNYIGNVTLYGDGCGDISPFGLLTLEEILGIAVQWNIPTSMLDIPADDHLPASKPDEVRLGFTFTELDKYIRTGIIDDSTHRQKIDELYLKNRFKPYPIDTFNPGLFIHTI